MGSLHLTTYSNFNVLRFQRTPHIMGSQDISQALKPALLETSTLNKSEDQQTTESLGSSRSSLRLNFRQHRARYYARQLRLRFQREDVVVFNTCRSPERVLRDQVLKNDKVTIAVFNLPPHRRLFNPENLALVLDKLVAEDFLSEFTREPIHEIRLPVVKFYNSRGTVQTDAEEQIVPYTLQQLIDKDWEIDQSEGAVGAEDSPEWGESLMLVTARVYQVTASPKLKNPEVPDQSNL